MEKKKNPNLKAEIVSSVLSGVKILLDTKFDEALKEGLVEEKPMTSSEVRDWLGISPATLQRRVKNNEIPYSRGSGERSRLIFYKSEINAYNKKNGIKTKYQNEL